MADIVSIVPRSVCCRGPEARSPASFMTLVYSLLSLRVPSLLRGDKFLLVDFVLGNCFRRFVLASSERPRNVGIGFPGLFLRSGFGLPPPHLIPVAHSKAPFVYESS